MRRKLASLTIIAALLVAGFAVAANAAPDPLKAEGGQFLSKAPWQILVEVSGAKEAKVRRMAAEIGLFGAARKLNVLPRFVRALVKYKGAEIDYRVPKGLITQDEADFRKEAIVRRLASRLARWIMGNWIGPDWQDADASDSSSEDPVLDFDFDPSLFPDDYFNHWEHNDDGFICKD